MNESLDQKIFESFIQAIDNKKLLTRKNIDELKGFIAKDRITAEDWNMLVDKDCFPAIKDQSDGK